MTKHFLRNSRGQSLIEFAMALPVIVLLALGVVETSWALLDAHIVTRLAREGSNLISRDTTLAETVSALQGMSTRPVDLNANSRVILSVIRNVQTVGAANYNTPVLYQRYEFGALAATSKLTTAGSGSFGPGPEYTANNSDNNTGLRVTNLPPSVGSTLGGMTYVTEIFSTHTLLTPIGNFGISMPQTLYSIAYF
jgi:Flp pilus assembly protein TadG